MWLNQQEEELLNQWIRKTTVPMLATLPNGEIKWCNKAYEDLVGYTAVELCGKITWIELTSGHEDAENDIHMANDIVHGNRTEYSFRKYYKHKTNEPQPVVIHVMRYPLHGEFKVFLVSVMPLDTSEFFQKELEYIKLSLIDLSSKLMENQNKPTFYTELKEFAKDKPVLFYGLVALLCFLLFGDRAVDLLLRLTGNGAGK